MKIKSRKKFFLLSFLLLVVLYLFWGPLFPWNPLKFGFKKIKSSKATVYITDFKDENVVYTLDEIVQEEEIFHGLEFKEKFKIIILGKESNMKRYLPWLRGSGYSVKLGSVNVIYLGTNARNSQYGIEKLQTYVRSYIINPKTYKQIFPQVYDKDLYEILQEFNSYMNQNLKKH